jgi:flagellar hook assembly protein FlgD
VEEEEEEITKLPTRFALSPGYPNPFNPTTTLRLEVPPPGRAVRVAIYDVQGRVVRTLLDGYRGPGIYTLSWDGRTERGEGAASGVYFAHMRAESFVETHKIVLIK